MCLGFGDRHVVIFVRSFIRKTRVGCRKGCTLCVVIERRDCCELVWTREDEEVRYWDDEWEKLGKTISYDYE